MSEMSEEEENELTETIQQLIQERDDAYAELEANDELLTKTIEDLTLERDYEAEKVEDLEEQLNEKSEKVDDLEEQLNEKSEKVEDLEEQLNDLQYEKDELVDTVDERDEVIKLLIKERNDAYAELDRMTDWYVHLMNKFDERMTQLCHYMKKSLAQDDNIELKTLEIQILTDELNELRLKYGPRICSLCNDPTRPLARNNKSGKHGYCEKKERNYKKACAEREKMKAYVPAGVELDPIPEPVYGYE